MQFYPYLEPHKAFIKEGEVFSKDLSEVQAQNERLNMRWEDASYFENLAKPPRTEKRKWIMFSIESFWGSIFKGEGVSHRNPRYEESLEILCILWVHETRLRSFSTLLLEASKVWLWGCVGGRYRWFSPPTLCLISWNIGHNHAISIISNELHKFWCIFDLRNNISKIDPKRTLFGPEGPNQADRHAFGGIFA